MVGNFTSNLLPPIPVTHSNSILRQYPESEFRARGIAKREDAEYGDLASHTGYHHSTYDGTAIQHRLIKKKTLDVNPPLDSAVMANTNFDL